MELMILAIGLSLFVVLLYIGRSYWASVSLAAALLLAWYVAGGGSTRGLEIVALAAIALAALFGLPALRRIVVTAPLMRLVGRILPQMGDTERIALEAGTQRLSAIAPIR